MKIINISRWTEAIELSRLTAKEQQKSRQGNMTKNISLIINIMDKEVLLFDNIIIYIVLIHQ